MNTSTQESLSKNEIGITAFVLILLSIIFFHNHIQQFPSHIHAWTQSDRYALSLGYVDNGLDLFHPATYNLQPEYPAQETLSEEKGITRVDLPLPDYFAAVIMTITGNKNPIIFRLIVLVSGLIGLLYFFALARSMNTTFGFSLFSTVFLFTCPVFSYYLNGFIPSIPAISLAFAAFYYYWKYLKYSNFRNYLASITMLTFAALIRAPFILPLISMAAVQLVFNWRNKEILMKEALWLLLFGSLFSAYYTYNQYLGEVYGSIFLNKLMPAQSFSEWKLLVIETWFFWKWQYFSLGHYFVLAISFLIFLWILIRKVHINNTLLKFILIVFVMFIGSIFYFTAMAHQFPDHDYYFIDSFYLPLMLFLSIGLSQLHFTEKWKVLGINSSMFIVTILMIYSSYLIQNERYTTQGWDRTEITHMNFEGSNKLCNEAGIDKNERVLVIDAYTYNVPLILLDHKGYTVTNTSSAKINQSLQNHFDFIAIQNRFLSSDVLRNYPQLRSSLKPIANNGKVGLYRINTNQSQQSYEMLLGLRDQKIIYSTQYQNDRELIQTSDKDYLVVLDSIFSLPCTDSISLIFTAKANMIKENKEGLFLVLDLSCPGENKNFKHYDAFSLHPFFEKTVNQAEIEVTLNVPRLMQRNIRFKCYLWNSGHNNLVYNDMKLQIVQYIKHTF